MEIASFEKFLVDKIKVGGKTGERAGGKLGWGRIAVSCAWGRLRAQWAEQQGCAIFAWYGCAEALV